MDVGKQAGNQTVDGKDRREVMKQTNSPKPAKKFESSGNDILGSGIGLDQFNPQIGN